MLPVLTVIGLEFAFLLGGLVVTEQVFNLNGIGMLFVRGDFAPRLHPHPGAGHAGRDRFMLVNFAVDMRTRGSTRGSATGRASDRRSLPKPSSNSPAPKRSPAG